MPTVQKTQRLETVKERLAAEVDRRAESLLRTSHEIHAHPELGFEERFAHDLLTDHLEREGLPVERHAFGLDTAFVTQAGGEGPTIAVCCEYDALPEIGHACGHNVIAAAGLGAGLAAAALADDVGGRIRIVGTPAEEGGGGKVFLADRGAFDDVDAAMMVHPAGEDLTTIDAVAAHQLLVEYHGQPAHAAAFPERGRNALDAAVLGYVNVAALRQHILPNERVHGIFTSAGDAANVVPAHAASHWYVRSRTVRTLEPLKERVLACLTAGAEAAGVTMTHRWKDPVYADVIANVAMTECYRQNALRTGRSVADPSPKHAVVGSTDMGNVSYRVPSIHPIIKVSPASVAIHTPDFTQWASSPSADRAVVDGAKALAMTVADLWLRPEVLASATSAFSTRIAEEEARSTSVQGASD